MQLVKKVKIYPTEAQKNTLWSLSNLCRLVYNFALAERKDAYADTGKGVSYKKQQNNLPALKKHYPHYTAVYSKVLQMALRTLDANYQSFFALRRNKYEKGLHTSLHNTGNVSRFVGFLAYKAERLGKTLIEIDERNTTKTCCACGKRHDMPLWKREMICDCGNSLDRDRNSAVNIMARFLSQNALWTSYQHFADNMRKTGLSIDRCSYEAPSERVV